VTLDLTHVERIDAAGIAALISLYWCADAAGNRFTVVNASAHVAEILALVGLDRILLSRNAAPAPAVRMLLCPTGRVGFAVRASLRGESAGGAGP
jgi:anti-anti-sigma regulatory factor